MKTIVEPKGYIEKLWGKQPISEAGKYRLMHYVLRMDPDGKVLLHNVVTGQLAELDGDEAEALDKLPSVYSPAMKQLVSEHYLVPENYQEDEQVISLRKILLNLVNVQPKPGITKYTVLPTTACNARCYYCYEKGIATETMTEEVAENVVRFITDQSKGQKVRIRWFGGEPTLAVKRIDQISAGLRENGIDFSSTMISNGYLFDEEMVRKASDEWNLNSIKISMDGVKQTYNRIKAYVHPEEDPYERILRNIALFLKMKIRVRVFMNFDRTNYQEFQLLLQELEERFHHNPYLQVRSHQLVLDYLNSENQDFRADEVWYQEKINELNAVSRTKGFLPREQRLPSLEYHWCEATSGSAVTIMPKGNLVSCPEKFSDDQIIGDLDHGITNKALVQSWRQVSHSQRCRDCILFPDCMKIQNCAGCDKCFTKAEKLEQYRYNILQLAKAH